MKILVKFPTRQRPQRFFNALNRYQHLRTTDDLYFLVTIDKDDKEMNNPNVINALKMWGNLQYEIIESQGKIAAINSGINEFDKHYDIILLASDDMIPRVKGYDQIIIDAMKDNYPDTDGVLWFNDGNAKDELNTLCILGKKYYDRFKYIYHPSYKGLWCDNEFMDVANILGKQKYFEQVIIYHEHSAWNRSIPKDQLNVRDNNNYDIDQSNYELRKQNNFDLKTNSININSNTEDQGIDVQQSNEGIGVTTKKRGRRKSSDLHDA